MLIINVSLRRNEHLKNPYFFVVPATTKTIEGPQKGGRPAGEAWRHPLGRAETVVANTDAAALIIFPL